MASNSAAALSSLEKSTATRARVLSSTSTASGPTTNKISDKRQHIQVAVRVRPLNGSEKKEGAASVVSVNTGKREIVIHDKGSTKTFTYDKVFGPRSTQIEVYREMVLPILEEVLMGYNCTIFAYGQTGTGKTFTMEGERSEPQGSNLTSWETDPLAGIIPRTLHQLFETLTAQQADFSIRVSFLELYNEQLFDLLAPDDTPSFRLFDDPIRKGSVVVQGLDETVVKSKDEVYKILERGANKRARAETLLNARSSRSHSIFSITVHIRETAADGEEMLKTGKLYLVDLAGSENTERSGAVGDRAKEAHNINLSLFALGRVITALVEHARHVPYRGSNLTRLLQDSLGGKTKTSIIATVSPSSAFAAETASTLDYAFRAKNITNKPEVNQKVTKKALLKEYAEEIERLQRDLQAAREKHGFYIAQENYDGMVQKMSEQEKLINDLEEKLAIVDQESGKALALFAKSQEELNAAKAMSEKTVAKLEKARKKLVETKTDYLDALKARDEEQFLSEQHQEKANKLHDQARELVSVNQMAVQSIQLLHGKLDRTKTTQEANERQLGEYRSNVVAHVEEMEESLNSSSAVQQELGAEQRRQIDALVETAVARCAVAKEELTKLNETFESKMMEMQRQMMAFIQAAKNEFQAQAKVIISKVDEVYSSTHTCVQAVAATQQKREQLVSSYEDSVNKQLRDLKDMMEEFVDHQFARDAPTGNTPSRPATQYRILRDIARASPRERLLERFREQYVPPAISADNSILEDTLHEDELLDGIDHGDVSGRDSGTVSLHNGSGSNDSYNGAGNGNESADANEKKPNGYPIGKGADGSRRRRQR